MRIRKATADDAAALHELYSRHLTAYPPAEQQDMDIWQDMLRRFAADDNYHLLVLEMAERIVSTITLVIVENLTHNCHPYALVENVVTHAGFRGQGYASALLRHASALAATRNCYKIMLLTGSKQESTLSFYRRNGFTDGEKTGFIKRV